MTLSRRLLLIIAACSAALPACATNAPTPRPTVLVAGATGQTGLAIVAGLRAEGYAIRALVRDANTARQALGDDVELVVGDVKDAATLAPALRDATAVISAVGARAAKGVDSPEAVDYEGIRNLARAAAEARVQHVVLVSSRGVTQEGHVLNRLFGNVLVWKLKGEDALRASGIPYTIIRPGGLINAPGGDRELVFEQGDKITGESTIARADVARICVTALRYPEARFKTFETSSRPGNPATDWQAAFGALAQDPR